MYMCIWDTLYYLLYMRRLFTNKILKIKDQASIEIILKVTFLTLFTKKVLKIETTCFYSCFQSKNVLS